MRELCAIAGLLVAIALPSSATAAWHEPVGGASPINQKPGAAQMPSAAAVGGIPYIAWSELDADPNDEIRVAVLNDAGTDWIQPWRRAFSTVSDTAGLVNRSSAAGRNAYYPSLTSIGDTPWVAWTEFDSSNSELRVARPGTGFFASTWGEPASNATASYGGLNQSTTKDAGAPSLTSFNGVPHVAWTENDGTNDEVRVARLESGTWTQIGNAPGPTYGGINRADKDASDPELAVIGGALYLAWRETDGTNAEVRVKRLNNSTSIWDEVGTGVSDSYGGVNQRTDRSAIEPSLADVGGVPHVAWREVNSTPKDMIRVARLQGNAWVQPWTGVTDEYGGINVSPSQGGQTPSLASIGGVPYVAWQESDGTADQLRVARLVGNTWEQVVGGASPINNSATVNAANASLVSIAGVPYLGWQEGGEIRVTRLEPEFTSQGAVPSATGATLTAGVHTFGIPYPVGFSYGAALERETTTTTAATGGDDVTITKQVSGLNPSTNYQFRPFATAGIAAPRVLGTTGAFTTLAATAAGGVARPGGQTARTDATAAVFSSYRISPDAFAAASRGASIGRRRRPVGTRVSYRLSEPATVTFSVETRARGRRVGRKCRRQTPRNRARRRCVRYVALKGRFRHAGATGANRFRFTGRLRGRKLRPGRYRLRARAVDAAGNASRIARTKFRIVRP